MNKITFRAYLTQLADNGMDHITDGPAADFTQDAAADRSFPEGIEADAEGFYKMVKYLYYCKRVDHCVFDAFMECWESFCRDAAGGDPEKWYDIYDVETITGVRAESIPDISNRGILAVFHDPVTGEAYYSSTDIKKWASDIIDRINRG